MWCKAHHKSDNDANVMRKYVACIYLLIYGLFDMCVWADTDTHSILIPGHTRQPTNKKLSAAACRRSPQRLPRSVSNSFICAAAERTRKEHVNPNWVPLDTQGIHVLPVCGTSLKHGAQCAVDPAEVTTASSPPSSSSSMPSLSHPWYAPPVSESGLK